MNIRAEPIKVPSNFPPTISKKLSPGETHTGALKPNETVEYSIDALRGDAVTIRVEQLDTDLTCTLQTSLSGPPILNVDREIGVGSVETVSFVAAEDGTYLLSVGSKYIRPLSARYSVRFASLSPATPEQQAEFEIQQLITKAGLARKAGQPKAAVEFAASAIEGARQRYGSVRETARVVTRAAMYTYWNGEIKRFIELADEGWALLEHEQERDSDRLYALENLSFAYRLKGNVERSEQLTENLLKLRTAQLGTDHPSIAPVLGELAVAKRAKGDYVAAMSLSRRSLELRERWYGENYIDLVLSLQNLASISYAMGDTEESIKYNERSLAIRRSNLPPSHPDIARTLNELGSIRIDLGDFEAAEKLLREAIAIREKSLGKDHSLTVFSRFSLGSMYQQRGEVAKAKEIFDEVWLLMPKVESSLPRSQATYLLQGLGGFYTTARDFDRSETALRRAFDERVAINGPESLEVGRSCDDLARLYAKTGRIADALRYQQRANMIAEKHLQSLLRRGSEQQKLNLIDGLALGVSQSISMHADIAPGNAEATRLAVETILNRKGRVLDALLATQARLNVPATEADRLKHKLAELNSKLSREMIARDTADKIDAWKTRIEQLIGERRDLYGALGVENADPAAGQVKLEDVRAAIPQDAALVEFKLYKPFGIDYRFGKEELIAYIVRREGPIGWVKLGNAQDIGSLVDEYRRVIGRPDSDSVSITRTMSRRIAQPILEQIGDATRLILSPDGPVNLLPFQALVDAEERYLVERLTVSYITSGRDLIRPREVTASNGVKIFADPSFGTIGAKGPARAALPEYFQPLRATRREADLILGVFPEGSKVVGDLALEETLKAVSKPKVLHIATHGFFLSDDPVATDEPRGKARPFWKPEFQLFRSGLVFARVNDRPTKGEDGVLTALEASTLDLHGTRLVVLSACDTGVGTVKKGEGVYGLRRAFAIAGAEALVMSLWQVSDHSTQELMAGYYKNLRIGLGRADSLRMVQIEMLKNPSRKHPYYWASFIHAGLWTPLDARP